MLTTVKDVSNVVFWLVASVVTVLSYLQARKSVFAPIRTETFKLQLKLFEDILAFFQNKRDGDFDRMFDFDQIVSLNTMQMAHEYASQFFHGALKVNEEKKAKALSQLIGVIVHADKMEKYFEVVDPHPTKPMPGNKTIDNPAIVLALWLKYEHDMIGYTEQHQLGVDALTRFAASPLLPKQLREYIREFRAICSDNLSLVGKVITECSRQMPEHYPTAADMAKFDPTWVWNCYVEQRKSVEPSAERILSYINNYLKVEDIMR